MGAVDRVARFDGPPEAFLGELLRAQCEISGARAGAVLSIHRDRAIVRARYPPPPRVQTRDNGGDGSGGGNRGGQNLEETQEGLPGWLRLGGKLVAQGIGRDRVEVRPLDEGDEVYHRHATQNIVLLPIRLDGGSGEGDAALGMVQVFHVETYNRESLDEVRLRLEISTALIGQYQARKTAMEQTRHARRVGLSLEVLSAQNAHRKFHPSSLALCNELASRFSADRASLGLERGRFIKLLAVSGTEKFDRKMEAVGRLEAAMGGVPRPG